MARSHTNRGATAGVTLEQVALAAGVSRATASRVLARTGRYAESTRQRVEDVARELGYVRNELASALAAGPTTAPSVGVVLRDASNPAYGLLLTRLQREALRHGLGVVSITVEPEPGSSVAASHIETVRRLVGMGIHGLLVATGSVGTTELLPYADRVPVLRVGRPEHDRRIHAVSYDESAHGRLLADHLWQLGHRRVVVMSGSAQMSLPEHIRSASLIRCLRAHGVEVDEVELPTMEAACGVEQALDQVIRGRATALAAPSDLRALEVLRRAAARGITVGPELSVTGCDGIIPGLDLVGLTTVRLPVERAARHSIRGIARLIGVDEERQGGGTGAADPAGHPLHEELTGELVVGASTCRPGGG